MQDSAKYLIHVDISADGVVERSDVVGAVFGQTEGLLGDELDLRDLQKSSRIGRIDVEIRSEDGQSFGTVTIASGLDRVETAILAAALETIDRVGPCRAEFEVTKLEDVRAAKRREIVDRATALLASFEEDVMSSREIVEEVRRAVRVEDITEYEGLPAGPRVTDSDAVIVVEGRADVLQLLRYGVKNAVAVEGTDVPDAIARLTEDRTVTAFLDGDRGGDLILKELQQVGAIDYVAFAPAGRSVEDLARDEVLSALREKVPAETVADANVPHEQMAVTDGSARPVPPETTEATPSADSTSGPDRTGDSVGPETAETPDADPSEEEAASDGTTDDSDPADSESDPETLAGFVHTVIGEETGTVVLLDETFDRLETAPAEDVFEAVAESEQVPDTVVLDGELSQRVLDVAAQRGVGQIVARSEGKFVKKPTGVRVRTADQFDDEV